MNRPESSKSVAAEAQTIDLRRLQVFVVSANHLSFAACAQQLGLTPSAVSHAIRSLEEELACILFQRHGPRVTLSRAGIRLLPVAEDLLERVSGILAEISRMEDESRQLRVGLPEFLSSTMLPKVLPDFFECFPAFSFEAVILEGREALVQALDAKSVDMAFAIGEALPGDFVRRRLRPMSFECLVAPFHRLAAFSRVDPPELEGHRLMVPDQSLADLLESSNFLERVGPYRLWVLPSLSSVRGFTKAGMGVGIFNGQEGRADPDLAVLTGSWPPLVSECCAYWSGRSQLSWAAEALLSFVETSDGF